MADLIKSTEIKKSQALFQEAVKVIPGGVNSPARAFRSVGGDPVFIQRAVGQWMWDEDGNRYLDLINSWGPLILGHAHPVILAAAEDALRHSSSFGAPTRLEVEMAKLVCACVPSIEKVRMVNSGTEATMSAIRLARGYTGREKVIKFAGCYHGHGDSFLIAAGSGLMTHGVPDSQGVTKGVAKDTLTAAYNDLDDVQRLIEANPGQIAAIIVEPVVGNMGTVLPAPGFLQGLRDLCDQSGILLIFDEVMTGFRLSLGGAQELLGVKPDITTLGKIIGGGLPVGAYGGRAEIMDYISPQGPIYQAGTLSGNPVAMAAGKAMLELLRADTELYKRLDSITAKLGASMQAIFDKAGIPLTINRMGSMITFFFHPGPVRSYEEAKQSDTVLFAKFFKGLLRRGIYLAPSQFEALFISNCITESEVNMIVAATEDWLAEYLATDAR
ncbi:MAG TPA: glutamate-1-semialdehyde 2,1-aminomutase [Bacteroidia bacterium]|nr:glutamate-1-semialdehyde 2,1-aminomutase [Bacteroidia bacterium]